MIFKFFYSRNYIENTKKFLDIFNITYYSYVDIIINIDLSKQFIYNKTMPIFYTKNSESGIDQNSSFDSMFYNISKNFEEMIIKTSETEELASSLSVLNTIIESIEGEFAPYVDKVEEEIIQLIDYKPDTKVRSKSAKILPNLIKSINNEEIKMQKGKKYISLLIQMISKETDDHVCEKFFSHLKEVIENCGKILNKNELNELFDKMAQYFENLKIKRNKLIQKKKQKNKKHKDDDEDDENINDLVDEDIEQLENIQEEIADNMGILLKTHKEISEEIISKLIKEIIPTYFNSQNMFEVKMSLHISDDLIEFIAYFFPSKNVCPCYKLYGSYENKETMEMDGNWTFYGCINKYSNFMLINPNQNKECQCDYKIKDNFTKSKLQIIQNLTRSLEINNKKSNIHVDENNGRIMGNDFKNLNKDTNFTDFYDIIIDIKSIKDICKGWVIKLSEKAEKDYQNFRNDGHRRFHGFCRLQQG